MLDRGFFGDQPRVFGFLPDIHRAAHHLEQLEAFEAIEAFEAWGLVALF